MKHRDVERLIAAQIARARHALATERALPLALAPALFAMFWAAFALFGGQAALGYLGASIGAAAALGGAVWLALRAYRRYRPPTEAEARARLEADAALEVGALAALSDQPSRLDPASLALWRRAQERAETRLAAARARGPRPSLAQADPYRLRYVAALAMGGGLIVAGADAPSRLAAAFAPDLGPLVGDRPLAIEAWVTPADYTGVGPITLPDGGGRLETPPGLSAVVRASGPVGAPTLRFRGADGVRTVRFVRAEDGAWEARLDIPGPGALELRRFGVKARWRLAPQPDGAPMAQFTEDVQLDGETLQFAFEARDDFGVRSVGLQLTPVAPPEGLVGAPPAVAALERPGEEPKIARDQVELDLLAHAYAGLEVDARIVATDAAGNQGVSAPVRVRLPEPVFLQPVAQAAIEARRAILWEARPYSRPPRSWLPWLDPAPKRLIEFDPLLGARETIVAAPADVNAFERAPPGFRRAARLLDALTTAPQDGYFRDLSVYAGLRRARSALTAAHDTAGGEAAADLLWHTALGAEYGDSADARRALEMAQRALSEAIARGAGPNEIDRLAAALDRAMQQYLAALAQEALQQNRFAEQDAVEEDRALSQQDLSQLFEEVRRLAKEGRSEEAQQLLAMLAGLMDNLEVRLTAGSGGDAGEDAQALDEAIQGLSGAMGAQRALRDDTERAEGGDGGSGGDDPQALADRQSALQRELDEARETLPRDGQGRGRGEQEAQAFDGARRSLDEAGEAMREAEAALRRGALEDAVRKQDEALGALRSGADQLGQEVLRREREAQGDARRGGGPRDPLGRASTGDGEVGVPDQMDGQRAREIRDELRRRAQDPRRPEIEREYLRRLLERFEGA